MPGENVIDVRFIDTTPGGGVVGSPSRGASGVPAPSVQAAPGAGAIGAPTRGPAGAGSPAMEDVGRTAGRAAGALMMLKVAADTAIGVMELFAYRMEKANEVMAARLRGDEDAARRSAIEGRFGERQRQARMIAETGGTIGGGIIGGVIGGPVGIGIGMGIGNLIGSKIGDKLAEAIEVQKRTRLAEYDTYVLAKQGLRTRATELSRYDARLQQQFAFGENARIRRDISEANIIGGALRDVEARQQQLDRLDQQIAILTRLKEGGEQLNRINKEMADRQETLNTLMEGLPDEIKKKVRELGVGVKDPFDELKEKGGFKQAPGGVPMAARERDLAKQAGLAGLNIPAILGAE